MTKHVMLSIHPKVYPTWATVLVVGWFVLRYGAQTYWQWIRHRHECNADVCKWIEIR